MSSSRTVFQFPGEPDLELETGDDTDPEVLDQLEQLEEIMAATQGFLRELKADVDAARPLLEWAAAGAHPCDAHFEFPPARDALRRLLEKVPAEDPGEPCPHCGDPAGPCEEDPGDADA